MLWDADPFILQIPVLEGSKQDTLTQKAAHT